MASIHKRFRSPYFVAAFTGADGRRIQRSTKTRDRELAMRFALEWSKAAKAAREHRLSETQCRKILSELHEHSTGEPLQFYTVRAWFDEWVEGKKGVTAPRTFARYQRIMREFADHIGGKADAPLAVLTQRDVRSFRDALARAGHSVSTTNQTLKTLRSPFFRAHQLGLVPANPAAGVELLRRDNGDIERDVFTPQQVRALLNAAETEDWKGAILCGYLTGLRLRDVSELRWESVDLNAGLLRVKTGKTGAIVTIPIHSEFAVWLKKQTRGIGKAPVFPSLVGKTASGRNGLSMAFKHIMERARIKGRILRRREQGSAGRSQSSLSYHSLRHSFNSALANLGVAQEIRQRLTGHSDEKQNKRYTHHEISVLRSAVDLLPRVSQ
jgi:integrase